MIDMGQRQRMTKKTEAYEDEEKSERKDGRVKLVGI